MTANGKKKSEKPEPEPSKELVQTGGIVKDRWKIIKKLGEGGFGAVYEVQDIKQPNSPRAAMKVEPANDKNQVLKMEVAVFRRLQGKTHVCTFLGCGRNEKMNFLVMSLVGKNLSELRRAQKDQKFSLGTSIRLGYQCGRGIEDVHSIGFLHRDVKPSNFAMGNDIGNARLVFILDFGLARQYIDQSGEMRVPRSTAGFRGTVRYASINVHNNKEMGRHDDLWCLFYQEIEFIMGGLPWKKISDREEVAKMKESLSVSQLLEGCPPELEKFHAHLTELSYEKQPNYNLVYNIMDVILRRIQCRIEDPYDWEGNDVGSTLGK